MATSVNSGNILNTFLDKEVGGERIGDLVTNEEYLLKLIESIVEEITENGKIQFDTVSTLIGNNGVPVSGTLTNGKFT